MVSKKIIFTCAFFLIVGAIIGFWIQTQKHTEQPVEIAMIQHINQVENKDVFITPKTTAELQIYFAEATPNKIPRVFVTNLPDDFAEQGNPELFAKVIGALVLRENETILNERLTLLRLKQKTDNQESLTPVETAFLDGLAEKYDSTAKRSLKTRIEDLMQKVDEIPLSMPIIQSALATDWGKKNMSAPFEQKGWIDSQNYGFLTFEDLPSAVDSYVRFVNGFPGLSSWRVSRRNMRGKDINSRGYRFLNWLGAYREFDLGYTAQLKKLAKQYNTPNWDKWQFLPAVGFEKGQISVKTKSQNVPVVVEIAKTPEQIARGLMFRPNLADGTGMIFLFEPARVVQFWMKNTYIPLDMVFFDGKGKIVTLYENTQPLNDEIRYPSGGKVRGVLELPAGTVARFGIKVGDTVSGKNQLTK